MFPLLKPWSCYFEESYPFLLRELNSYENFSILLKSILQISQNSYYIDKAIECNQKIIEIYDNYFVDIGFEDDSFSMSERC